MRLRKRHEIPVLYISDTEDEVAEEDEDGAEEIPPPPSGEIAAAPTAGKYRSVCTESTVEYCAFQFKVSPEFGLLAPTAAQRAHDPPPGYAAVYVEQFRYGLRLPPPPFAIILLDHYGIAPAQLHPACIFNILGFVEICEKVSIAPTVAVFRHFFDIRKSRKTEGWYTFFSRYGHPKIVYGQPNCVSSSWKESFMFFKIAPLSGNVRPWNHSPIMDPPLLYTERPSKEVVSKFLANVKRFAEPKVVLNRGGSYKQASVMCEGIFIYSHLLHFAKNV